MKTSESKTHRLMRLVPRWDLSPRGHSLSLWQRLRAEQVFVISFLMLIVVGTLGFWLVPQFHTSGEIRFIDALFTITSAVCVTGLTVLDTATAFTFWGQLWILLFIQLGGLGIITLSSIIILALGRRLSLRSEEISGGGSDVIPKLNRLKLIRDVLLFTIVIEAVGAAGLFWLWQGSYPTWQEAAWHAVFHSVSGFCNAGFSTFTLNLIPHAHSSASLLIVGGLIVVGGIGFLVLEELFRAVRSRDRRAWGKLSLHTKIVLAMTALLLVFGAGMYAVLEWKHVLKSFSTGDKITNAFFMSASWRTAGFNTINYADCHASTAFLTIIFMAIGGSPGSTAGGLKTTTVALIALLAWSKFMGRSSVSIFSRTIPDDLIQRAVGLFVFMFALVTIGTFALTVTENNTDVEREVLLPYMFEATSAFNTVGLSMGATSELSDPGKYITSLLMFLGRVGPMTFAAAIALADLPTTRKFRFAKEEVVIG